MSGTRHRTFDIMEMAFVYGVVTMALDGCGRRCLPELGPTSFDRVTSLLNQAGYDVTVVVGSKVGRPHEWLEVGFPGLAPEIIVDISAPDLPFDTVLLKRSRAGGSYLRTGQTP